MMYYVLLEGRDGFQKEEERAFPEGTPPHRFVCRQYENWSTTPIGFESLALPPGEFLKIKERCFYLKDRLYVLGKHVLHYVEER
jgi:hypothetical protein